MLCLGPAPADATVVDVLEWYGGGKCRSSGQWEKLALQILFPSYQEPLSVVFRLKRTDFLMSELRMKRFSEVYHSLSC